MTVFILRWKYVYDRMSPYRWFIFHKYITEHCMRGVMWSNMRWTDVNIIYIYIYMYIQALVDEEVDRLDGSAGFVSLTFCFSGRGQRISIKSVSCQCYCFHVKSSHSNIVGWVEILKSTFEYSELYYTYIDCHRVRTSENVQIDVAFSITFLINSNLFYQFSIHMTYWTRTHSNSYT